jgi:hypothetical protein
LQGFLQLFRYRYLSGRRIIAAVIDRRTAFVDQVQFNVVFAGGPSGDPDRCPLIYEMSLARRRQSILPERVPPSPVNLAFDSQKSIIIASASVSLYSPFGRLYVSRGFARSTGPELLGKTSFPSPDDGFDTGWPLAVAG